MRAAAMSRFIDQAAQRYGIAPDYDALYRWSIEQPAQFWPEVWDFCDIRASQPWDSALENAAAMPGARWFGGSRLNFAENLLRYRDDRPALIFRREHGAGSVLNYRQLYAAVARLAAGLRALGVAPGDRVAAYLPNSPHAVIAMLASASIGAVWSSCSPDFGARGVLERFGQIQPRVLFAADGYHYNGKRFEVVPAVAEIAAGLACIERVVMVAFLDSAADLFPKLPPALAARAMPYAELGGDLDSDFDHLAAVECTDSTPATSADNPADNPAADLEFAQLPFDHPLYILYSSGTTGAPKCIAHGAGGTLIQHLKEHRLHLDLRRDDKLFYITTCGWMMWNWLISGLASGCALVLYDGAPMFPRQRALWQLAAEVGITVFGASARYLAALAKADIDISAEFDLTALRAVLSTGSPLAAESFDYVYQRIKGDVMLASISGGTDIASCFVLGNPLRAVYRGEIQGPGLGMAVAVYAVDESAAASDKTVDKTPRSVRDQRGELVCVKPFPSMPLGFWGEPDQRRYHEAYFSRFPGVWAQGDYAEITARDGVVIYGRADATLNPGGVRIGTAEIYRQVEKIDEVLESICIGQTWDGDIRIVLFVALRAGAQLDAELAARIREVVKINASPRHVPKKIIAVADIPRTLSGKIVELAVRDVVHGKAVNNIDALANPEALDYFRDLPQLAQA